MRLESTTQESINGTDLVLTTVIINGVESHCILTRLLIDVLGRPGVSNDMELVGGGQRWVVSWTYPHLSIAQTQTLIETAIAPTLP